MSIIYKYGLAVTDIRVADPKPTEQAFVGSGARGVNLPAGAAPASVSPQATTGECAGVFDMIAARKVWWAALSDRGDPNQLTGTWDAFSAGYYAAFDEARRRQGGTAEGADWETGQSEEYMSNDELRDAIQAAWELINKTSGSSDHYQLTQDHYKALLKEQERRAMLAAPRPDAGEGLVQRYKWLLEHAQSGGFMPRAVNEVRIDVTVLEGQRLSLKRLTGKELDSFIVAALEAARALGRGEAGEGGK